MTERTRIIFNSAAVTLCVITLVAGLIWAGINDQRQAQTAQLRYEVTDADRHMFFRTEELDGMLREAHIHPEGVETGKVPLQYIENTIRQHPMVRNAECYTNQEGEVVVQITQREPIVRVENDNETYYIGSERERMPARKEITDKYPLIRGHVGQRQAAGELADMAIWISKNQYWNKQIAYIGVQAPKSIYLVQREQDRPLIILGEAKNYVEKLHKLRVFMEEGAIATQDKHYRELDLRYNGQVIGRN